MNLALESNQWVNKLSIYLLKLIEGYLIGSIGFSITKLSKIQWKDNLLQEDIYHNPDQTVVEMKPSTK